MTVPIFDSTGAPALSQQGIARRGEILALAQRAAAWRRRRRIGATALALAIPVGLAAALPIAVNRQRTTAPPTPIAPAQAKVESTPGRLALAAVRVETDPAVLDRYSVRASGRGIIHITDEELSDELRRAGHDPGVIRSGRRVIVTAAPALQRPLQ